jgi:glycosyltransferase involved in cell wall biosynthesis
MPLVSVIIPTRNRADLVRRAIESVLASCNTTLQAEIIVVDDGSTDQTASVVQSYPIKYIRGVGKGVSTARNTGLKEATGTFITFLDDDDAWPENNLSLQIKILEEGPEFGAVCSQVVLTNNDLTSYSSPYPAQPFQSGWMFEDFLSYIPQVGSLLVRREVVDTIGGFEPGLHGGEDWDWALRLSRYCQIAFAPEVALLWRMHGATRVDGAGNKRPEDITWRRYTDVMLVAHRYTDRSSLNGWIKTQRIILKHKGHYVPLFIDYANQYLQSGNLNRALGCCWMALRVSPAHLASHSGRAFMRQVRYNTSENRDKRQSSHKQNRESDIPMP